MINQKKYFKINIGLYLLGVLLIVLLGQLHRYKIDEYNKFLRVPKGLEIVNLGSSHGRYGFKYPENVKAYNLAVDSQPFYYDLKIIETFSENLKYNAIVLIPVSIFSFYQGYNVEDLNQNYYSFLKYSQIYEANKDEYFLKNKFPLLY